MYRQSFMIQYLLHHPFRDPKQFLTLNIGGEEVQRTWTDLYLQCQQDHHDHPRDCLRIWSEENRPQEDTEDEDEDVAADIAQLREEDWMLYAQLFPNAQLPEFSVDDLGNRPVDNAWDPNSAHARWQNIDRMASYIQDEKRIEGQPTNDNDNDVPIDPDSLSPEQRDIYDLFIQTYQQLLSGQDPGQINLNIDGTAGCGKSYLIRCVCQKLRQLALEHEQPDPIRVIAPSGVAALNTNGQTIHSALLIPTQCSTFKSLTGSKLASFQQSWKGVHFVLIDEKSMLGQRMFARINARLKQLKPNSTDQIFGGFNLSLIGDFAQLPPVKDRALYAPPATEPTELGQLSLDGHNLYQSISRSFRLQTIHRQQGNSEGQVHFRTLLKNASNGGLTFQDWQLLQTRYLPSLPADERARFDSAVGLFTTAEVVGQVNLTELSSLNQPCARILAKSEGTNAKNAPPEDAGGLEQEVVLAKGAKVMITRNLWQTKGYSI